MSDRGKGGAAAIGAAVFAAVFYIVFKAAGVGNSRPAVVMAMVLVAALLNTATWLVRGSGGRALRPVALVAVAVLALFTVLGNVAVAYALAVQEPALTATVLQTQILFVAVTEWILLRHPITWRFGIGAVVALGGFVSMQLGGGAELGSATTAGVLWALLASCSFAIMNVATRAVITRIEPVSVNAFRLWVSVAALACFPGNAAAVSELDLRGWVLAGVAAFAGPFLSRLCLMAAVRFIAASETALVTMIMPLFAFILGFAVVGTIPSAREIIGGLVILGGVLVPMWPAATARSREGP